MICRVGAVGAVFCHDRQRGQRCCGSARTGSIGNVAVVPRSSGTTGAAAVQAHELQGR